MAGKSMPRSIWLQFTKHALIKKPSQIGCSARCIHQRARVLSLSVRSACIRPTLKPLYQRSKIPLGCTTAQGTRSIFIQTRDTPNSNALKFIPDQSILPPGLSSPYIEYNDHRSTLAPPYPSPLAAQLLSIDGVTSVFYGSDFITITKEEEVKWEHINPEVYSLITETITSGTPIVTVAQRKAGENVPDGGEVDSLSYNVNDSEVVGMIKELLETRIRPSIQADGGDIEFRGFEGGNVLLKLRGACKSCESSSVTLKNGIQSMLMHYIEEVKGVTQVSDPEDEIAAKEFARFEEKLQQKRGNS